MTTVPPRPSNPVVAPHTSSADSARMGSGLWTVKGVSARSGRQVTVPVTISTGSWRMAASLVFDSQSSNADPCLLDVTSDSRGRLAARPGGLVLANGDSYSTIGAVSDFLQRVRRIFRFARLLLAHLVL